jgi:hypothetical protein
LKPAIYGVCTMTTVTQLSLLVDGDCSVAITPISDTKLYCSNATNTNYADLRIQAFYQTVTAIRSLLPATDSLAGSSSFLISLEATAPLDSANDGLTFKTWQASTIASTVVPAGDVCTAAMLPAGGKVASRPTDPVTTCPAGSYSSSLGDVLDPTAILYCMPW